MNGSGSHTYSLINAGGELFRLMPKDEQERLMDTIAGAMTGVPEDIQRRQIGYFMEADPAYGGGIAERLGVKLS